MANKQIEMSHGSGGLSTSKLIHDIFSEKFSNRYLDRMEDSAVCELMEKGAGRIALTTDSYVVTPLFFPGGDIGRLSVCGTVNDLLMSGARPRYLTCGFILEEGLETDKLERIAASMADTAAEAGVMIVTGDTKVVEKKGAESGLFINTAGVGVFDDRIPSDRLPSPKLCSCGDTVIVTGVLGDHHAAILSSRMGIENGIVSDAAPLTEGITALIDNGIRVHAMRDITRGGLATILNEFAESSGLGIEIEERRLPVSDEVRDFCGILGLDPLYMGNEGKAVIVVPDEDTDRTLEILGSCRYTQGSAVIGKVTGASSGRAVLKTTIGGRRLLGALTGEGLPRIC